MRLVRVTAAVLVACMIAVLTLLALAPRADAQETYIHPPKVAVDEACPAGSTELFSSGVAKSCTVPDGYSPVTSEADCQAADAQSSIDRGWWITNGIESVCFGGGLFPDPDPADCANALFLQDIVAISAFRDVSACVVQVYKLDSRVPEPSSVAGPLTDSAAIAPTMSGDEVTVSFPTSLVSKIDLAEPIKLQFNPVVFDGLMPANRKVTFTFPPDRDSIVITVSATLRTGQAYSELVLLSRPAVDAAPLPVGPVTAAPAIPRSMFELPAVASAPTSVPVAAPVVPPPVAQVSPPKPDLAATGLAHEKPLPFGQAVVGLGFAVLGMTRLIHRRRSIGAEYEPPEPVAQG